MAAACEKDPQTQNRYAYVRNNPMSYTDPTGAIIGVPECDPADPLCPGGRGGCDPGDPFCNPCDSDPFLCYPGPENPGPGGGGGSGPERPRPFPWLQLPIGFFTALEGGYGVSIRLSSYIFSGLSNGRCTWTPTCQGTCSSPHTTNPDPSTERCWTNGPYKKCIDVLLNGKCFGYRVFCTTSAFPGVCN